MFSVMFKATEQCVDKRTCFFHGCIFQIYRFSEVEHLKTKLSRLLCLRFKIRVFRISLFRMVIPKCGVTRHWVSCFSGSGRSLLNLAVRTAQTQILRMRKCLAWLVPFCQIPPRTEQNSFPVPDGHLGILLRTQIPIQ